MSNVTRFRQTPPSPAIAQEFGRDLHHGRQDPSDPEACQEYLFDLYPHRLREIVANREAAMDVACQMILDKVNGAVTEDAF